MKKILLPFVLLAVISINAQTKHVIAVEFEHYIPNSLTIYQGDTVEWVNTSPYWNNVNGNQATYPNNAEYFYSGPPSTPWVYSHVFTVVGTNTGKSDVHAAQTCTITVLPQTTTQITEVNAEDKIKIFPNPAMNYFLIQTKQPLKSVLLYNINGKLVKSYTQVSNQLTNFNIKDIPTGVYFLNITMENDTKLVEKLIIN